MGPQEAEAKSSPADVASAVCELASATEEVAKTLRQLAQTLPAIIPATRPPWGENGVLALASKLGLAANVLDGRVEMARAFAADCPEDGQ